MEAMRPPSLPQSPSLGESPSKNTALNPQALFAILFPFDLLPFVVDSRVSLVACVAFWTPSYGVVSI